MQCDVIDTNKKYGGFLQINNMVSKPFNPSQGFIATLTHFKVYIARASATGQVDPITTKPRQLQCIDTNATVLWYRFENSIDRSVSTCTCWYDDVPGFAIYCKYNQTCKSMNTIGHIPTGTCP
jgi:hypothetical protein